MKLTAIILLTACIGASARTTAQTVSFSGKDVSLQTVFDAVTRQTGYTVFCNYDLLRNAKKLTLNIKNATIDQVMQEALKDQSLTYTIIEKTIVIKAKANSPNADGGSEQLPPPIDIKGRIVNEKGEPVAASIIVKGTNKGTSTNDDGEFELKGVDDNATLVISGVSIESFEVKVNGRSDLALNANTKTVVGQEVVINKGYYSTTQKLNTGSVIKVTAETIQKQPVSNPLAALEGRVPGLYLWQVSGVPGGKIVFNVRGINSIANGNEPLFIIDGVPFNPGNILGGGGGVVSSPFNNINPNDIESIEILKDADATGIYGSRGANGVILITTKKGKPGKTRIGINFYSGLGKVTRKMDMLNTSQYLQMRHEAFNNDGQTPQLWDHDINGDWDTTRSTDWQKVFIGGTSHIADAQSSISGGSANTQFSIGGGYHKETTVFPGKYSDQKGSFHLNLNNRSDNNRFKIEFYSTYIHDDNKLPQIDFSQKISLAPDAPAIYDANGNLNWQNSTWTNPYSELLKKYKASADNLIGSILLGYEVIRGLQLKNRIGYNEIKINEVITTPQNSYNPEWIALYPSYTQASSVFTLNNIKTWVIEPQINYSKTFGSSQFEALIGGTFQRNAQDYLSQTAEGFSSDALIENMAAASRIRVNRNEHSIYKYNAFFGRIGYNWKEKYLINLTGRRDGSSRFGSGRQFGNFGAIGAGWIFSKEKLFQNLSFLSFGKLRLSYGTTGNDQLSDYQYLSAYTPYSYSYQGNTGLIPARLANPLYSWELVKKLEAGLEFGFLKDRILLTASSYRYRTNNQLVGYSLPTLTGFSAIQANLPAIIQNSGFEFLINATILKRKDLTWLTSLNLSIPRNKLISYPNLEGSSYANQYEVGKSLYLVKKYHYTGLDPQTGIYGFEDVNNDNQISYPEDLQDFKEVTQRFYGGVQNTLQYKGWELDFFFQFVKQTGYDYTYSGFFNLPGGIGNQPNFVMDRWQKSGDNARFQKFTQDYGSNTAAAFYNMAYGSDGIIVDASFVRLKNLFLSYQLPELVTKKIHLENCKLYLQAQNVFTITNFLGLDPENNGNLPPLRVLSAGITLNF